MSPLRWVVVVAAALVLAAATGGAAVWFRDDDPLLSFLAFSLGTLPAWIGLGYLVASPDERVPHHEDTVESQWAQQATSGAFLDLFVALGVTTSITSIADLDPLDPALFLVLGMADVALRYYLLQRRES